MRPIGGHCTRPQNRELAFCKQAILDMMRILTAIILLALGAYVFKRDTTVLVLVPIERMFKKVGTAHAYRGAGCC